MLNRTKRARNSFAQSVSPTDSGQFLYTNGMFTKSLTTLIVVITVFTLTLSACKSTTSNAPQPQTLSQLLTTGSNLTLLRAALTRAGLDAQLGQTGTITLFAPSDAAFQAAGYADAAAINSVPADTLKRLLQYHLLGSKLLTSTLATANGTPQPTLAGPPVYITKTSTTTAASTSATTSSFGSGSFLVNEARIVQANTEATNGVVHVIDKVLMPPAGTILQVVQADTSLSLLTAAALRGGVLVTGALSSPAPALTVFAPTNAAFRAAGFPNAAAINAAPATALTAILTNHVLANARAYSPTLISGPITTFGGGTLTATVGSNGAVTLQSRGNGAAVSNVLSNTVTNGKLMRNRDINATNGVIHKIDRVLMP